jgi:S1-C subfamily serine protease
LVSLDGKPVTNADTLLRWLEERRPGDEVPVEFLRDGSRRSVRVRLTRPD